MNVRHLHGHRNADDDDGTLTFAKVTVVGPERNDVDNKAYEWSVWKYEGFYLKG